MLFSDMPEIEAPLDEETKAALRWVKELLADPAEFERWANETLDMSRMRKLSRLERL
jgi:hypothetical protein